MSVKNLEFKQHLQVDIDTAWAFFSDPGNLAKITPPEMNFIVHTDTNGRSTYAGQMIVYTVSPLLNIPMTWITEITHVKEPFFFVDEQRKGPYKLWHHQHHFQSKNGGVEMTDILHYEVPFGIIGNALNSIFIEKKIKEIFLYRKNVLEKLFPTKIKA